MTDAEQENRRGGTWGERFQMLAERHAPLYEYDVRPSPPLSRIPRIVGATNVRFWRLNELKCIVLGGLLFFQAKAAVKALETGPVDLRKLQCC